MWKKKRLWNIKGTSASTGDLHVLVHNFFVPLFNDKLTKQLFNYFQKGISHAVKGKGQIQGSKGKDPTGTGVRKKTLRVKSPSLTTIRRSSRLMCEGVPVPVVTANKKSSASNDLTRQVENAPRTSKRLVVPTIEKGIEQMEAKKRKKRPAWQY
jgi:hypothetical protein